MSPGFNTGKVDAVMVLLRFVDPLYASMFSQSNVTEVPIEDIDTDVPPIDIVPDPEPYTVMRGFASKPVGFRSIPPPELKLIAFSPLFKNFCGLQFSMTE